jgi:hypothetical protein
MTNILDLLRQSNPLSPQLPNTGLNSGLENLAQQKLQQVTQRNNRQESPQQEQGVQALQRQKNLSPYQQGLQQLLNAPEAAKNFELPEGLNKTESKELYEAALKQRTNAAAEKKSIADTRREAREYLAPYEVAHNKGQKNIKRSRHIISIADKGDIRSGTFQAALDKVRLGDFFQNVDTQVAQKSLAAQAQNAAAAFNTSRLTNLDVNLYKQSLGTLWNTREGLKAVSRINIYEQKAEDAKLAARRAIIRENNGEIPFDIEALAEERAQPELQKYAKKSMDVVTGEAAKKLSKNTFNSINDIPKDKLIAGKTRAINTDTGKEEIFNGKEFVPIS